MKIGELLRERGWVEPSALDRAIAEQRHTGKRLVSLLVARGLLAADEGARALGQQHSVAAALDRHLTNRDRRLTNVIPPELARSIFALPIGRGRSGELIVCVRDPRDSIKTAISAVAKTPVLLAVAPAIVLEKLVEETYGQSSEDDGFDVDLSTGPIEVLPDLHKPMPPASSVPTMSSIGLQLDAEAIDPLDLGSLKLVELDDSRVTKDFSQTNPLSNQGSGMFPLPGRTPTPAAPFAEGTVVPRAPAKPTLQPRAPSEPVEVVAEKPVEPAPPPVVAVSLDDTLVKLERATTRDDATDIAMVFAKGRWSSALLLTIREGVALGHRGHGGLLTSDTIQAVTVPLAAPSIVRSAHDARRLVTELPPKVGAIQDRLTRLLGAPTSPAAAPVLVGQRIACVLVVGDARESADATEDMTLDLDDLSVALGLAYARILREAKR